VEARARPGGVPVPPDDADAAGRVALRLLARANHTAAMLRAKLLRRGFTEATAEEATRRAVGAGYLDERAFSEALVRRRTERSRWGRSLIARELAAKGVEEAEIERALAHLHQDREGERERALAQARQRIGSQRPADYPGLVARIGPYLQGRGYSSGLIRNVIRRLWEEHQQEGGRSDVS